MCLGPRCSDSLKQALIAFACVGLLGIRWAHAEIQISTVTGNTIFYDNKTGEAVVTGNAKVVTSTATLTADKISVWTSSTQAHLEGNVTIVEASGTLHGSEVFYDWVTSTGVLLHATGESPPWRFSADRMVQVGPNVFELENARLTSCTEDPPHYQFRANSARVIPGKRATLKNSRLILDESPSFWSPYYTRSLVPTKYTLRVEPGNSGRDGLIVRTTFGYPFTPHTMTKFKWDYYQYTGSGFGIDHRYDLPNVKGDFNSYYIEDRNSDPQPQARRYNVNWDHFEKFTPRLTGNAHLNFQSDQTFGNNFYGNTSQGLVLNETRGLLSQAGLNYQFPKASLQAQLSRQDRFDSAVSSRTYIAQVVMPTLSFNTIPLKFKGVPFYSSFGATYINQTQNRSDPTQSLHYQHSASVGTTIRQDLRLSRNTTLTPRLGASETWQDSDFTSTGTTKDLYQLRYNTGLDLRHRFWRIFDGTIGHSYAMRLESGGFQPDVNSDDHGVEANQISASIQGRLGRDTRLTVSSGADLRSAPKSQPEKYDHLSERITPPSLDLQYQASKKVGYYFRETYSLFDTSTLTPQRTPLSTSGEVQIGGLTPRSLYFSQGFSFSKTPTGTPSVLNLNNRLRTYLTKKWYIELYLSYIAEGPAKLNYRSLESNEKSLSVVRDMHCWVLRMQFSDRTGVHEASFFIDLKANMSPHKNLFSTPSASPFLDSLDESTLFPEEALP